MKQEHKPHIGNVIPFATRRGDGKGAWANRADISTPEAKQCMLGSLVRGMGSIAFDRVESRKQNQELLKKYAVTGKDLVAYAFEDIAQSLGHSNEPEWRARIDAMWDAEEGKKKKPFQQLVNTFHRAFTHDLHYAGAYFEMKLNPDDIDALKAFQDLQPQMKAFYRGELGIPEHLANEMMRDYRAAMDRMLVAKGVFVPNR